MEHYIYKITNNINDMYYYGKRSCKGLAEDDKYMGSSKYLTASITIHGKENYTKLILAYSDTEEGAYELEKRLIKQSDVDNHMCYNQKLGGAGCIKGTKHTPEHCNKMSKSMKGKNKGQIRTLEQRNNISIGRKGIKPSAETVARVSKLYMKPIIQINKTTGAVIKEWPSIKNAGEELNLNRGYISQCCNNKAHSCGGFIWMFKKGYYNDYKK